MQLVSTQDFTGKNLTSWVELAELGHTLTFPGLVEPVTMQVHALLGRTGGLIDADGTLYEFAVEVENSDGETAEYAVAGDVVSKSGLTQRRFMLPKIAVQHGDKVRVLCKSSSADDDDVDGRIWIYFEDDEQPYSLEVIPAYKSGVLTLGLWVLRMDQLVTSGLTLNSAQIIKVSDNSVVSTISGGSFTASGGRWRVQQTMTLERSAAYVVKANLTRTDAKSWDLYSSFARL